MAMNFNQMLKFQQIKNAFKRFDQDHPKFKNFMNAVWREQALKQDAVIEISITSPEGKNYCSNIKLNAADIFQITIFLSEILSLIFTVILPQTPDFSCF